MLAKQDSKKIGRADITDLNEDWLIRFQHRHYLWLMIVMAFIVPSVIAGIGWGDYMVRIF